MKCIMRKCVAGKGCLSFPKSCQKRSNILDYFLLPYQTADNQTTPEKYTPWRIFFRYYKHNLFFKTRRKNPIATNLFNVAMVVKKGLHLWARTVLFPSVFDVES